MLARLAARHIEAERNLVQPKECMLGLLNFHLFVFVRRKAMCGFFFFLIFKNFHFDSAVRKKGRQNRRPSAGRI